MANGVTTEWEDIHVKLGNFAPRPVVTPEHEYQQKAQDKLAECDPEKAEDSDEFDDDDEFARQYAEKRKAEMLLQVKHNKYGQLYEISRDEYVKEVTQADPESFVVLNLYQSYIEVSELFNQIFCQLAKKYADVKFIKIIANKCSENFPDVNVPTLIIYKGGKLAGNLLKADRFMLKVDVDNMEKLLHQQGIIKNPKLDPKDEELAFYTKILKEPFKNSNQELVDKKEDRDYMYENQKIQEHRRHE